jgi:integrase family protein with SAM-like domain
MSELTARPSGSAPAVSGDLVDPRGPAARAAEVAARQRSPDTRHTYAAVYRTFAAFLGPQATPEKLTPEAVRVYRDALKRSGRSPATVDTHLSALRGAADAVGADAANDDGASWGLGVPAELGGTGHVRVRSAEPTRPPRAPRSHG